MMVTGGFLKFDVGHDRSFPFGVASDVTKLPLVLSGCEEHIAMFRKVMLLNYRDYKVGCI